MSDEPAGNGEAAGATKGKRGDDVEEGAGEGAGAERAEATAGDVAFSEAPSSFSPGPAFFSSPAGSMLVATETASAGEAPVTAVATGEAPEIAKEEEEEEEEVDEAAAASASAASAGAASDEWDDRQLCIDGGCVGVLDETGACLVCGKVDPDFKAPSSRPAAALRSNAALDDDEDDGDGGDPGERTASASGGSGDEWDDRKLCEDGACIGVVIDGRCNTCGRAG